MSVKTVCDLASNDAGCRRHLAECANISGTMTPEHVRVLIADDHQLMREGTAALLATEPRISIVALAADGLEAVERAIETEPDVILLDLNMPKVGGMQASAVLRNRLPKTQILILTVSEQAEDLYAAVRLGAAGYLLKDMPPAALVSAVLDIHRGEPTIAPQMAVQMLQELSGTPAYRERMPAVSKLTERETQVLAHLSGGHTNREIAERLRVSEATVKTHVRHVLEKLHMRNRTEAAAFAARVLR
jgi:two-component system NarL family response regulator